MPADDRLKLNHINQTGRHFVVDYWECDSSLLNNADELVLILNSAAEAAGAKVMSTDFHKFKGQGVTAVSILAESHISIHTWPEKKYAAVDIYTCGNCNPLLAHQLLTEKLYSSRTNFVELERGESDSPHSITMHTKRKPQRSGLENDSSWFLEGSVPGRRHGNINHGFAISQLVARERTPFQEYLIFDTPLYGRVLVLDGIVQLSTSDEHIYHDMLIHPPMFVHPEPKHVLIVGGGDGGALREVLKHNPQQVVMIDIDEQFVRNAAKHLPSLHNGAFEDPRLELLFEDASTALSRFENTFDVAIIDCNDAIGTSEVLFEEDFYASVARSLKDDAVCSVQAGSMLDMDFLSQVRQRMSRHLGHTSCFKFTMPCYHCGEYVFMLASKFQNTGIDASELSERQVKRAVSTKYWTPEMHHASQVFPPGSPLA